MKNKKIFFSVSFIILVIIIGLLICLLNPSKKGTDTFKVVFISKGTLSPPHQLITTISVYQNTDGTFQSEYQFQDGTKVTSQDNMSIDKTQFYQLVSEALKVSPDSNYDAFPGCTGGSTYNLVVYRGKDKILNTGNYRCNGKDSNPSLSVISGEMLRLFWHPE